MKRKEIFNKVKTIIDDNIYMVIEEVKEESDIFIDLCFDSLDCIELIIECEKEFDINLNDNDILKFTTVKEIVDYLHLKLADKIAEDKN